MRPRSLGLVLVLSIGFVAAGSCVRAATAPGKALPELPSCPNAGEAAVYSVDSRAPQQYTQSEIDGIGNALTANGMPVSINIAFTAVPTAATSFGAAAVEGLYSFLVDRAKQEAEAYAVEVLNSKICSQRTRKPYFPNTCQTFSAFEAGSGDDSAVTLNGLQRSLEQDVRYLPACLLKIPPDGSTGTVAGYLIFDAVRQLTSGTNIDTSEVVYGLVTAKNFAAECGASYPGVTTPTVTQMKTAACKVFEATTAVAAALELTAMNTRDKGQDLRNFLTLYLYDLAELSCSRQQANVTLTVSQCGPYAQAFYLQVVQPLMGTAAAPGPGLASLIQAIAGIRNAVDKVARTSRVLESAASSLGTQNPNAADARETVVQLLVSIGEQIGAAIAATSCLHVGNSSTSCGVGADPPVDKALVWAGAALQAYGYISAKRYVEAVPYVLQVVTIADNSAIPKQYMTFIAEVAESKSSADFEKALNSVASPVGAWRKKKTTGMWTVDSFVGGQVGWETLTGSGVSASSSVYYGAYVPLGFAWSHPVFKQSYAGVYIQALDLGVLASDHSNRNQADAGTNGGVARVLSPGVGIFLNPSWLGPVTFGLGYVFRSPGLRKVTQTNGETSELDSRRVMFTVGVDVTVFELTH